MSFVIPVLVNLIDKKAEADYLERKYSILARLKRMRERGYIARAEEMERRGREAEESLSDDEYTLFETKSGFRGIHAYGIVLEVPNTVELPRGFRFKRVENYRSRVVMLGSEFAVSTPEFARHLVSVLRAITEERGRRARG